MRRCARVAAAAATASLGEQGAALRELCWPPRPPLLLACGGAVREGQCRASARAAPPSAASPVPRRAVAADSAQTSLPVSAARLRSPRRPAPSPTSLVLSASLPDAWARASAARSRFSRRSLFLVSGGRDGGY